MEKLKDCPFCGKHNLWTYRGTFAPEEYRHVKCAEDPKEDDGCVSGVSVSTWNKRPIEDALTATIAQKDAEIERLTQENAWLTEKALMTPDELELMEKLKLLYEACMKADLEGELSEYIDGSILDNVSETLKTLEVNDD